MKLSKKARRRLASAARYFLFFLSSALVVTCCFLLFFNNAPLSEEIIRQSAPITFFNIILLSLCFSIIDWIYRKITVERYVKRILEATEKITDGDFSVRIKTIRTNNSTNEFDEIISGFNKMAQELSSVETLRTDFIANVSHELKTPLAVMQNYGTLLQSPDLTDENRIEYAKAITSASRRLANLITNILKLNKLENQQIFPSAEPYNLGKQLIECLLSFEDAWSEKEIDIETDIDDELIIEADAELLSLVWNNLFSNAVKFTPKNGRIAVSLKKENGYAVVKVSDTGCGITSDVGEHIFEKFYQGDASHALQGNGLGLALVKRIMDITNGEISVDSVPDKGSTFCVKLKTEKEKVIK